MHPHINPTHYRAFSGFDPIDGYSSKNLRKAREEYHWVTRTVASCERTRVNQRHPQVQPTLSETEIRVPCNGAVQREDSSCSSFVPVVVWYGCGGIGGAVG
jgi:hypothetical protein